MSLLNTADDVRVGSTGVDAVYLGATQVWGGFDPLSGWSTQPVHAFWASDPLWTPNGTDKTDGAAVVQMRNGGSGYTQGAYLSGSGLVLPGTWAGNYASTPDSAALSITGDIDIRVRVALTDWTPASATHLLTKGPGNALGGSWNLSVTTSGKLNFMWNEAGTGRSYDSSSSVAAGVTDGATKWIRVTLDVDNGSANYDLKFWLSDDGSSWSQLGSTRNGAATSIADDSYDVQAGSRLNSNTLAGTVYRAIVKDGIDGTTVFDADFSSVPAGRSAFIESSSNAAVVTVRSTVNPSQATGSKQPTYRASTAAFNDKPTVQFDGTDDWMKADPADFAQPYYLVAIAQVTSTAGSRQIMNVANSSVAGLGYVTSGGGKWQLDVSTGGSPILVGGTPDTNPHLFVCTANGVSSNISVDGASVVTGDAGTGGFTRFILGSSEFGSRYLIGHIAYAAVFTSNPTSDASWFRFKSWVTSFYGITVA